jgi:hypothetical protein
MKTRNLHSVLFATTLSGLLFTACKKSTSDNNSSLPSDTELQTQFDDEARVFTESNAAFDDANTAMISQTSVTGASFTEGPRSGVTVEGGNGALGDWVNTICNATVTIDSTDNPRTITITYNGKTADSLRNRKGSVVISIAQGVHWSDAGAVVTVSFNNLAITRLSDSKTITLNGTHTYTNVSGGSLANINNNNSDSVIHTITSSNMSITFDNGTTRTWSVARKRIFLYNGPGTLIISQYGTYTDGTLQGVSEWGTDRYGNSFTAQITNPLWITEGCGWQVSQGTYVLTNAAGVTTVVFGLTSTGQGANSCPVAGSFYYLRLQWVGVHSNAYSIILPY